MNPLLNAVLFSPLLLLTLNIWDPTEACSCMPVHPQRDICSSNIVIRANILSKKVIKDASSPVKIIQYEIKQIEMFKGVETMKEVQYVFTPRTSATCGVKLKKNKQYLLSGTISDDGRFFIYLCKFIKPWNDLTASQKINLNGNYEMGCDCEITNCLGESCPLTSPSACLWFDWLNENTWNGQQANNYACFKGSDGACSWHLILP